jgi:hypothetical protein
MSKKKDNNKNNQERWTEIDRGSIMNYVESY